MAHDIKKYLRTLGRNVILALKELYTSSVTDMNSDVEADILSKIHSDFSGKVNKLPFFGQGVYQIEFIGQNVNTTPLNADIESAVGGTPAAGDKIILVSGCVTATGQPGTTTATAVPPLVSADTSNGIKIDLVDDGGDIKARFGRASAVNYSTITYHAWVLPK